MEIKEILNRYEQVIAQLSPLHEQLNISGKLDLTENNIYIAYNFISKINGLNQIFSDEFIKDNNLKQIVELIDRDMVKMEATHFSDKNLFYEFINIIFPQLQYRLSQIKYRYSLSKEEQGRLLITAEYQVYLYNLLKYYLEKKTTPEVQEKIKEILSIVNLYRVTDDKNIVALGSEITYMDSLTNEVQKGKIVINSHGDLSYHKLALKDYKLLINHKAEDIVFVDYSTSYFIRILDVKNIEEKPHL